MRKLALSIALLALVGFSGCGTTKKTLIVEWGAPEFGSHPQTYVVQVFMDGEWRSVQGEFLAPTKMQFKVETGHTIVIRVRGVDRILREGPWSEGSELYIVRND